MSRERLGISKRLTGNLQYPFWWQFFAWHLTMPRRHGSPLRSAGMVAEGSDVGVGEARVVVIIESDLEHQGVEGGAFRERTDLLSSLSRSPGVEIVAMHDASVAGRISPDDVVELSIASRATHVVVVDLAAVRMPRAGLLRSVRALRRRLDETTVLPIVVMWDLLNPTFTLGAKWLTGDDGVVLVMPNTTAEAQCLGLHRAVGPCADLIAGTAAASRVREEPFSRRPRDVFLPPAAAGYRAAFVDPIRTAAERANLSISGGWFDSFGDYIGAMGDARICVVVNVVKDAYLRGPIPRRVRASFPDTNMVARNVEALSLGTVLLAQDTLALRTYVRPFIDYVPWTTADEAIARLKWLSDKPDEAERIAASGRRAVEAIVRARPSWGVLTDTQSAIRVPALIRDNPR